MTPRTNKKLLRFALLPLAAAAIAIAGCGSSMISTGTQSNGQTGSAFLVGTDAPLASVVSFQVQLMAVELTNGTTTTSTLVNGTPTVDFARFNGLQTLVDMNQVPAGTYTGVTFVLGTGTVAYLNTSGSGAPTIATAPAAFSTSTVTFSLAKSLVIGTNTPPVGLRMDFDLAQSIPVNSSGQIETNSSGAVTVNPTIDVSTVTRTDTFAHIDLLYGSVVTAPTSMTEPSSFTIQGPHGEQFTINTSSTTEWDGGASLSSLNTSSVVEVAGTLDPADQTLDADEVALVTNSKFYARGLVTYVTPTSGAATNLDFYVRAVEPSSLADVPLGGLAQVNITGNENYGILWMHNAFTQLLFNSSALTPGQEIIVGGTQAEATPATGSAITVNRIHLENWGYEGTIVSGSQNSGQGTFQMQITGFAGQVVPSTVTVYLGPACDFRFGFAAFNDLANGAKIRVVGLLLKNSTNGNLVLLARHIDGLQFTDTATTAWQ
jgi:Domain of unknown function (DUF5666)/Domain of unknown function (DUF4382)